MHRGRCSLAPADGVARAMFAVTVPWCGCIRAMGARGCDPGARPRPSGRTGRRSPEGHARGRCCKSERVVGGALAANGGDPVREARRQFEVRGFPWVEASCRRVASARAGASSVVRPEKRIRVLPTASRATLPGLGQPAPHATCRTDIGGPPVGTWASARSRFVANEPLSRWLRGQVRQIISVTGTLATRWRPPGPGRGAASRPRVGVERNR